MFDNLTLRMEWALHSGIMVYLWLSEHLQADGSLHVAPWVKLQLSGLAAWANQPPWPRTQSSCLSFPSTALEEACATQTQPLCSFVVADLSALVSGNCGLSSTMAIVMEVEKTLCSKWKTLQNSHLSCRGRILYSCISALHFRRCSLFLFSVWLT